MKTIKTWKLPFLYGLVAVLATGIGGVACGGGEEAVPTPVTGPASTQSLPTPTPIPPGRPDLSRNIYAQSYAGLSSERDPTAVVVVKLADTQSEPLSISITIANFIIVYGYEYSTEIVELNVSAARTALLKGDVDVLLEGREQDWQQAYNEEVAKGTIKNLGMLYMVETVPINKLVWSGIEHKAPDVDNFLEQFVIGLEPLKQTETWVRENSIEDDWERAAVYYLTTFEDQWKNWLPQDNYNKVKAALEMAGR